MNTQSQQILKALKSHKEGIHPTYIIETLHIFQYNARIHEIRKQFGCECKNGYRCSAQEHIVNKRLKNGTTLFMYERVGDNTDWDALINEVKEAHTDDTSLPLFS